MLNIYDLNKAQVILHLMRNGILAKIENDAIALNSSKTAKGTNLFLLTNSIYRLDIPPTFVLTSNLGEVLTFDANTSSKRILQLRNILNSANYFSLNNELTMASGASGVIQPTAIGRLLTPW